MQSLNSDYVPSYSNSYASYNTNKIIKDIKESNLESNLNSISNVKSVYDTPTKYGFNVDSKGFFGADFNKAAGIPQNVKIHIKTMDMAVDYASNEKTGLEPIEAISRAWKFFKAYTNNAIDLSGDTNITQEQMLSMPAGYSHDGSIFGNLVKIYQTRNDTREQNDLLQIENLSDGSMKTGFSYAFGVSSPADIEKGSLDIIHNEKRGYIEVVGLTQNNDLDTTTIGELFHNLIILRSHYL